MTDKAVELDKHRGMVAQKATDLRRLLAEVAANERALRATQEELEAQLIAAPASSWPRRSNHRGHAHDQQLAQILVAHFSDPTKLRLAAGRMLARHEAEPGLPDGGRIGIVMGL